MSVYFHNLVQVGRSLGQHSHLWSLCEAAAVQPSWPSLESYLHHKAAMSRLTAARATDRVPRSACGKDSLSPNEVRASD